MTCTWCERPAVQGGQAPKNVRGQRYLLACEVHTNKIAQLKFVPIEVNEIKRIELREKAEKK